MQVAIFFYELSPLHYHGQYNNFKFLMSLWSLLPSPRFELDAFSMLELFNWFFLFYLGKWMNEKGKMVVQLLVMQKMESVNRVQIQIAVVCTEAVRRFVNPFKHPNNVVNNTTLDMAWVN